MFEKKKRKKKEANIPPERYETEEDLKALHRAGKIQKDPSRMVKARAVAKEKLEERRRRGRTQSDVKREDNTV